MDKIKLLDPKIINLIAAGEVVERPASVLKEILENSLDAGATKVIVRLIDGGVAQIEVEDDGWGMSAADAEMAFTQHATSKIGSAADLENILTFGFRGEALASIAAVADVELETYDGDRAVKLLISKQDRQTIPSAKRTPGTTILVKSLFGRLPARQKFLKTSSTEYSHCYQVFINAALVNIQTHLELYHNQKLTLRLAPVQSLTDRVLSIWDAETSTKIYKRESSGNGLKLQAYVGSPDIARRDHKLQYIFVNKRPVSDRMISRAVVDAFRGFIHRDLQPTYFLVLEADPKVIDVNVHPRKQEVKFANQQGVYGLVFNTVRKALEESTKQELDMRIGIQRETSTVDIHSGGIVPRNPLIRSGAGFNAAQPRSPISQRLGASMNFTQELLFGSSNSTGSTSVPKPDNSSFLQVFNTYIIWEQGEQIVVIDQHAAAEKVLYERILNQTDLSSSQRLLVPEVLELTAEEKEIILSQTDQLQKIGLEVGDFGGNSLQVTAKPLHTPELRVGQMLAEIASRNQDRTQVDSPLAVENPALHLVIATAACHGSIRAGQKLAVSEMQQLISDLSNCAYPFNCPHGRPVSWSLSRAELERNFKRVI